MNVEVGGRGRAHRAVGVGIEIVISGWTFSGTLPTHPWSLGPCGRGFRSSENSVKDCSGRPGTGQRGRQREKGLGTRRPGVVDMEGTWEIETWLLRVSQ